MCHQRGKYVRLIPLPQCFINWYAFCISYIYRSYRHGIATHKDGHFCDGKWSVETFHSKPDNSTNDFNSSSRFWCLLCCVCVGIFFFLNYFFLLYRDCQCTIVSAPDCWFVNCFVVNLLWNTKQCHLTGHLLMPFNSRQFRR